ncbi:MAG TPA: M24 family metallopeptidase, partial [Thermoleophilia bacterium]|nr:M24 family metallopeptidase [Thermoleophilia bacterium]
MIIRKIPEEIEAIARAGRILRGCLDVLSQKVEPGVSTKELDRLAEEFIRGHGGTPTFKGYRGFPGSICT